MLYVADARRQDSLDAFWAQLTPTELAAVEAVAMDMWEPYVVSTRAHLPEADRKMSSTSFTSPGTFRTPPFNRYHALLFPGLALWLPAQRAAR